MPIDPLHSNHSQPLRNGPATVSQRQQAQAPTAPAAGGDHGNSYLSRLGMADGSLDIDAARVAEIRRALADGTLQLDTARVADGIIASARELLGAS